MFGKDDELTLDDGRKYIVFDSFDLNNKNYLYLVSLEENMGVAIVENNNGMLNEVENEEEYYLVLNELIRRNKDGIEKYMEEIDEN